VFSFQPVLPPDRRPLIHLLGWKLGQAINAVTGTRRLLRRSLATLLISNGENVKVARSQLRHTTPNITLELYAQAVSADQQKAHKKVVQMVLPAKFPEKLKARSTAPTA
jgi:integrase